MIVIGFGIHRFYTDTKQCNQITGFGTHGFYMGSKRDVERTIENMVEGENNELSKMHAKQ